MLAVPRVVEVVVSVNVTVPDAVPPETAAVRITACPQMDGLVLDVSAVVVAACCTTCVTALDVVGG